MAKLKHGSTVGNYPILTTNDASVAADPDKLAVRDQNGRLQVAEPSDDLDAVNKQYVDTVVSERVSKSGDTMTGLLTLSGDPTEPLHAATKQYVDNNAASSIVAESGLYKDGDKIIFYKGRW